MIEVRRLGHATLTTPDLDRQIAYYTEVVGLTLLERDSKRAVLASKQGFEAIALEPGVSNALSRLAFQVAPGTDLADVTRELERHGVKSERRGGISPGVTEAIVFKDPKDALIEVFSEYVFAGEDPVQACIMPLKLGHVAYRVNDVQRVVKFYTDVLGFRVSDWRDETFAFLRCGPDHHPSPSRVAEGCTKLVVIVTVVSGKPKHERLATLLVADIDVTQAAQVANGDLAVGIEAVAADAVVKLGLGC